MSFVFYPIYHHGLLVQVWHHGGSVVDTNGGFYTLKICIKLFKLGIKKSVPITVLEDYF